MDFNKENLTDFMQKLMILYSNMNEFLNKFSTSVVSTKDYIDVNFTTIDGTTSTTSIPTVGHMKADVVALRAQIESMINVNDNTIGIKFSDGTTRTFNMSKLSSIVNSLESISGTTFDSPTTFRIKNNWFFESYLNPLLFVSLDVSKLALDSVDRYAVKRVILNTKMASDITYFNSSIKGRTDLKYETMLTALDNQGIDYTIDDNIVEMPVAINRYRGTFSVTRVFEDEVVDGDNYTIKRRYKIDKMFYYDVLGGAQITKYLTAGDRLLTANDSEYEVVSVDATNRVIQLARIFGTDPISIGADMLRIKPTPYRIPEIQINIGYNEREIIFITPISRISDLSTDMMSNGVPMFTNELSITLSSGTTMTLDNYYNSYVSDFGMMFLNYVKEKQLPASVGIKPDSPILDPSSFKVTLINDHLKETASINDLKSKISAKERLDNQVTEKNDTINKIKSSLAVTSNANDRLKLTKDLDNAINDKSSLLKQLSTIISEITLGLKSNSDFSTSPKYRVRGFFDVPTAKITETGSQEVVQFIISYRYISKTGNATNVNQIAYTGKDGSKRTGFFSNWTEVYTKSREKEMGTAGVYIWKVEDTQNPDVVNINQVDIPINNGESVEFRIMSVSEAGFPLNPVKSDWSSSVIIDFPADLSLTTADTAISDRIYQDEQRVMFQEELDSRGLDLHLSESITTADKYWPHNTDNIQSGYFTPEGKIISLFEKIKSMSDQIQALSTAMSVDKGMIKVSIVDSDGNVTNVSNGGTISMFAGYYKDAIANIASDKTITYDNGMIVTKTYVMSIENTSNTPLELAARLAGGIDVPMPTSASSGTMDEDYRNFRLYDKVPLMVSNNTDAYDYKRKPPFQSTQVRSQVVYARYTDIGGTNSLYFDAPQPDGAYTGISPNWGLVGASYADTYPNVIDKVSAVGPLLVPYFTGTGGSDPNIVNIAAGAPNGNLSQFCIHIGHPMYLSTISNNHAWSAELFAQTFIYNGVYAGFTQALGFDIPAGTANKSAAQVAYNPTGTSLTSLTTSVNSTSATPVKMSFHPDDYYLVGMHTCGAYLFMSPNKYDDISIDGTHPNIAKKVINYSKENAINIPIVFQFRCADKLGYVGGWKQSTTNSANVTYTKKIGIDIYLRDVSKSMGGLYGDIFSFDFEASCKYNKDVPTQTSITVPSVGNVVKF
jgi:hypothetical protein